MFSRGLRRRGSGRGSTLRRASVILIVALAGDRGDSRAVVQKQARSGSWIAGAYIGSGLGRSGASPRPSSAGADVVEAQWRNVSPTVARQSAARRPHGPHPRFLLTAPRLTAYKLVARTV